MSNCMACVRISALCGLLAGILIFPSIGSAQQELLPNLKAFPAYDVVVVPDFLGGTLLRFSTLTWNGGDGPLELIAGETNSAGQNVYQRVYFSDGTFDDHLAGTFEWHPEHNHVHFADYANYLLQPVNAPGGSQRTSSKTTFCIMDTDRIDRHLPGAPRQPVYTTCNATRQGMSVGWGDEYYYGLAGQAIDLTGLPDGDYRLTIAVDPKNRLLETHENDNAACVLLRISISNRSVAILDEGCADPGGDVTVVDITPNTASQGSVGDVTITGTGFAPGMDVRFENGSGPAPSVSNVTWQDATTITATVTVKHGGPARERIWDVRVGAGVLVGGFTVVP